MALSQNERNRRYIAKLKAKLIDYYGNKCRDCPKKRFLDFAHTKTTKLTGSKGRGKLKRLLDVKNNLDCYTLLCKRCHLKFDLNWWEKEKKVPF